MRTEIIHPTKRAQSRTAMTLPSYIESASSSGKELGPWHTSRLRSKSCCSSNSLPKAFRVAPVRFSHEKRNVEFDKPNHNLLRGICCHGSSTQAPHHPSPAVREHTRSPKSPTQTMSSCPQRGHQRNPGHAIPQEAGDDQFCEWCRLSRPGRIV